MQSSKPSGRPTRANHGDHLFLGGGLCYGSSTAPRMPEGFGRSIKKLRAAHAQLLDALPDVRRGRSRLYAEDRVFAHSPRAAPDRWRPPRKSRRPASKESRKGRHRRDRGQSVVRPPACRRRGRGRRIRGVPPLMLGGELRWQRSSVCFTKIPLPGIPERMHAMTFRALSAPAVKLLQRAARPDQPSRVAIEQSKGIRRALRVEAVQMHSVLIVATVDPGHGDSVGRQVGGVPWEQPKVLVVLRSAPSSHARGRRTARRP